MNKETITVGEIRQAYQARQDMLERIKNNKVSFFEADNLDMLFKMNAAEYVGAMLKHYDDLKLKELGALNTIAALPDAQEVQELVDEIEALKAENAKLRGALTGFLDEGMIHDTYPAEFWEMYNAAAANAREVLKGDTE